MTIGSRRVFYRDMTPLSLGGSEMQAALLWQMASLARADPASVRPMIAVIALATIASGVIAWRFIFPVPALFTSALVIAPAAAFVEAS